MAGPDRRWRWLLRLLPSAFRDEHGAEIVRVWRGQQRAGERHVWAGALIDTLKVAPREHASFWWRNLRYAVRRAARTPMFTLAVILTLALGTGASGAVFSLINAVLLRPMPWRSPEAVGLVWAVAPSGTRTWLSFPELEDLRRVSRAVGLSDLRSVMISDGRARELQAVVVSHDLFTLLGVAPQLGRSFTPEDDRAGAPRVVILSDAFWRTQFGGDPSVIGRSVTINDQRCTIVGILPATFSILPPSSVFPDHVDVWLPLEPQLPSRERSVRFLHVLLRVEDDGYAAAGEALHRYAGHVATTFPSAYADGRWDFTITPFEADVLRAARRTLVPLAVLVVLVLAAACTNVASLMLARGTARRGELAVRTALGAGPATLAGELLAESLVLAAAGSAAGLAIAAAVPPLLRAIDPAALPRLAEARVDARVVLAMLTLVVATAVLFASVPLLERLRMRSLTPIFALRGGGRSRAAARCGAVLATAQIAFASTVVATAAVVVNAFVEVDRTPLGFAPDHLLTVRLTRQPGPPAQTVQFFDRVVESLAQLPGSAGAAAITQLPLSGAMLGSTFMTERALAERRLDADLRGVTSKYFEVAGIPLIAGRYLSSDDVASSRPVAVVDDLFARALQPDGAVVGRRIRWIRQPDSEIEIVGVVGRVRHRSPEDSPRETVYRPHAQYPRASMYAAVRTSGDPAALTAAVNAAIVSIDPYQPIADVATMDRRVRRSMSRLRTALLLAGALAVLTLTLSAVGVYGVLNFDVVERRREFGVRMALGAGPSRLRRLVVGRALAMTVAGVVVGAAGTGLLLAASPFPQARHGGWEMAAGGIILVAMSSIAAVWMPARRASSADPLAVFRPE
jgi:putative ABC transport system permease protein